jgi:hypothetical protein
MIPHAVTIAVIEGEELGPAVEWAKRKGVELRWDRAALEMRAVLSQRSTGEQYYLMGRFDGYRALPPCWDFRDVNWESPGDRRNYPAAATLPGIGGSSLFHTNPVICAHFNRLAYKQIGGPHSDWGGPEQWLQAARGTIRAETMADMIAVIGRDLSYSPGRMS